MGVLVGGGLMAVTPAGAEVSNAVATNWNKIWNKELKPQADQRYYTKKKSDKRYYTKSKSNERYYAKWDADAKYQLKGNYALNGSSYTKAESDGKYIPKPVVMRGMYSAQFYGSAAGQWGGTTIDFPVPLASAPQVHFIPSGSAVPANCTGSGAAPGAAPGHLCIFERYVLNRTFINSYGSTGSPGSDPTGVALGFTSAAAGAVVSSGTWALGVSALASTASRGEVGTSVRPGDAAGATP
ncbi:hypothetical protein [Nocardioides sp. P5_E3]